ncbi:unnamed protein product, partial [Porites lobata]
MATTTEGVRGVIASGIAIAFALLAIALLIAITIIVNASKIIRYVHDTDGRILSLLVDFNSFKFNIVCLYAPNTVTYRGDFNCIDSELDLLHIKSDFSADKRCLSALSPISVLLIFFVRGIPKRSLLPGLIKIFPKLLASIAFLFLPLSFSQFAGTNVFLPLSPITT